MRCARLASSLVREASLSVRITSTPTASRLGRPPPLRSPAGCLLEVGVRGLHGGSVARMAEIIMNVPTMGDSITEGTLQSWAKQVGESVKVDEVVAVIETDKVSVEIRAKDAGVLVQQFANVDDTLLKIDTEAAPGSVAAPATAAAAAAPAVASAFTAADTAHITTTATPGGGDGGHGRTPLIKFLGKRSLLKPPPPQPASPGGPKASSSPLVRYEDIKGTPGAKTFADLPPLFGRPALSKAEMEAVESGGAL